MRKHPLIAFFVLAYLLTWWIYPLLRFSPLLGIPGLFGPALAAPKGSVLIATLFHGAINISQGLFLGGIDGAIRYWLLSIVYGAAALAVAVFALGLKSSRKPAGEAPLQARDV